MNTTTIVSTRITYAQRAVKDEGIIKSTESLPTAEKYKAPEGEYIDLSRGFHPVSDILITPSGLVNEYAEIGCFTQKTIEELALLHKRGGDGFRNDVEKRTELVRGYNVPAILHTAIKNDDHFNLTRYSINFGNLAGTISLASGIVCGLMGRMSITNATIFTAAGLSCLGLAYFLKNGLRPVKNHLLSQFKMERRQELSLAVEPIHVRAFRKFLLNWDQWSLETINISNPRQRALKARHFVMENTDALQIELNDSKTSMLSYCGFGSSTDLYLDTSPIMRGARFVLAKVMAEGGIG